MYETMYGHDTMSDEESLSHGPLWNGRTLAKYERKIASKHKSESYQFIPASNFTTQNLWQVIMYQ
jgi:hypothetical protein